MTSRTRPAALLFCCLLAGLAHGGRDVYGLGNGSDGTVTLSGTGNVINAYAALPQGADAGATELAVADVTSPSTGRPFQAGRLVLVLATGGLGDAGVSSTSHPASALDLRGAAPGRWELARLSAWDGGTALLDAPLLQAYPAGAAQLVAVPEYAELTLDTDAEARAAAWTGSTGGVLAFLSEGTVTLLGEARLEASGSGFRGGGASSGTSTGCSELFGGSFNGAKGEGVSALWGTTGRANAANGGGGGACDASGGGGGGHRGPGGKGGQSRDGNRDVGGFGGAPLTYDLWVQLLLGGGGGGGAGSAGRLGGAGGGLLLARVLELLGPDAVLAAAGAPGDVALGEGAPGGGAGGTVVLRSMGDVQLALIDVAGGPGGSGPGGRGPGGGGAGGLVLFQSDAGPPPLRLDAGAAGQAGGSNRGAGPTTSQEFADGSGALGRLDGPLRVPGVVSLSPALPAAINLTRLTLGGPALPRAVVEVRYDGVVVATPGASDAGAWSAAPDASLAEGPHVVTLQQQYQFLWSEAASFPVRVDLTAPQTTLTERPPALSNDAGAAFAFSSDEPGQFECRLDGAAYALCASPRTVGPLADGPHSFEVRALDEAGNADRTPERASWTIDTVAPAAPRLLSPIPGSTVGALPAFEGTAEPLSTVRATLADGGAVCSVAVPGTGVFACAPVLAVSEGPQTFAVTATDPAGNTSPVTARSVRVDGTLLDTSISGGPAGPTRSTSASFVFTSTAPQATFECSLNDAAFTACTTPRAFTGLTDGSYRLRVRARAAASTEVDLTPARRDWEVDTVAPQAPVVQEPLGGSTVGGLPTFSGTAELGAQVVVRVDGEVVCQSLAVRVPGQALGEWSCAPAVALSAGQRSASAVALDAVGNTSEASAARTFEVSRFLPDTAVVRGPLGLVALRSASFAFASDFPGATFECDLDNVGFAPCGAEVVFPSLAEGPHLLLVRAVVSGLADPSPAQRRWTVDSVPPGAPTIELPAAGAVVTTRFPTVQGRAEAGARVEVRLDGAPICLERVAPDGGAFSCRAGLPFPAGPHRAVAVALDEAGNSSAEASRDFSSSLDPPPAPLVLRPAEGAALGSSQVEVSGGARGELPVTVLIDQAAVGTTTSSPDGGFSLVATVADGPHQVTARVVEDERPSPESAPVRFTVDTRAPAVSLRFTPQGITLSADEPRVTFSCALDMGAASPCSSPFLLGMLTPGTYRLTVVGTDAAGNRSAPTQLAFALVRDDPQPTGCGCQAGGGPGVLLLGAALLSRRRRARWKVTASAP